jgi:hypothetical protein
MFFGLVLAKALLVLSAAQAENFYNLIGSNRPLCRDRFTKANPDLAPVLQAASPAALLIRCGDSRGTAIFLDTPSRRVVVSALHIPVNYKFENGKFILGDVISPTKCTVRNPVTKKWIKIDQKITPQLGHPTDKVNLQAPRDWMVLALAEPISGVKGFEIAGEETYSEGAEIVLLGAIGWNGKDVMNCTYVNRCNFRDTWSGRGFASLLYTDCSSSSGQSGGPLLVRDSLGQYKVAALLSGSNINFKDGAPYDKENMSTTGIALAGPVVVAIDAVEKRAAELGVASRTTP